MSTTVLAAPAAPLGRRFVERLNGPWHERALWAFLAIVLAHWAEHVFQAVQVFVLGWPRPESRGLLGLYYPWLVKSEALHYGYALVMLVGLWILRSGFTGLSARWWVASLAIQVWHHLEHALLQGQALLGHNLWGSPVPTSVLQALLYRLGDQPHQFRVELHLFYNAAVFIPMVVAMWYHRYPPAGERAAHAPRCSCARPAR